MNNLVKTSAAIALAVVAAGAAQAQPRTKGEAELAKLLEGRVAGAPVSCIPARQPDVRIIEHTALVYGSGRTIYVNRTENPRDLDDNYILVTEIRSTQLCSVDIVRLQDRSSGMYGGFIALDKFVPYRRVDRPAR